MPKDSHAKIALVPKPTLWILICILPLLVISLFAPVKSTIDCYNFQHDHPYKREVLLNFLGQPVYAEKASTEAAREQGLSGRVCINKDQAMLFTFDQGDKSDHCFWMKDMLFPIDIFWLDKDKRVVFSAAELNPNSYPKEYCPNMPTMYVIELHSGVGREVLLGYDAVVSF